jgi:hypothetical protein
MSYSRSIGTQMTSDRLTALKQNLRWSHVIHILLVLLCVLPSWTGPFTRFETRLKSPVWWMFCTITAIVFLVAARQRKTRIVFGVAVAGCLAMAGTTALYFFPMRYRVETLEFQETPVRHVLAALSQQRTERPWYRFVIDDELTRDTCITVSIRDGDSLQNALDQIASAADAEHHWTWFSSCGHTSPPSTVLITLRGNGEPSMKGVWELVNNRVWLRDNGGMLITDNSGVSFDDAEAMLTE